MHYTILEIQLFKNGTYASIKYDKDTKVEMEQTYHEKLMYAAASGNTIKYHSIVVLDEKGEWYKGETYDHSEEN